MSNYFLKTTTIDIHHMVELEARKFLEKEIIRLHKLKYKRLIIIHGYKNGDVLKTMVNKTLKSNLIKAKNSNVFNLGETEIILK